MVANSGGRSSDAGGGPQRHIPVLLREVIAALEPTSGKIILDGTFGAGGYTQAILDQGATVIALDRDPIAIAGGQAMVAANGGRLSLIQSQFSDLAKHAPQGGLDGVVLDIGVSSMQIDEAERGFSFQKNGPLDMRMSSSGVSAADVVNRAKVGDLIRIFGFLGEEKQPGRIARAIEKKRAEEPFRTTRDLAGLIEIVTPRKAKDKIHPATRVFQALRVFVNDELGELAQALFAAEQALKPGGRLVVVTFHSLEDRIVKKFFADRSGKAAGSRHLPMVEDRPAIFDTIGKPMIAASDEEAELNPRARSAKLRAGLRTSAPARAADFRFSSFLISPALKRWEADMLRTFDIVLVGVMVAAAVVTYSIKHKADLKLEEVRKLEAEIKLEKDTIDLLRADWALLTQPNRLHRLVNAYQNELGLSPTMPTQLAQPRELPMLRSQLPQPPEPEGMSVEDVIAAAVNGSKPGATLGGASKPKSPPAGQIAANGAPIPTPRARVSRPPAAPAVSAVAGDEADDMDDTITGSVNR